MECSRQLESVWGSWTSSVVKVGGVIRSIVTKHELYIAKELGNPFSSILELISCLTPDLMSWRLEFSVSWFNSLQSILE